MPRPVELRVAGYVDRTTFIVDRCRGRKVLDLGVVGMTELSGDDRFAAFQCSLHWKIAEAADETVGADHADDVMARLESRYPHLHLVSCDINSVGDHIRDQFEVVVMGDLVEHLSNPGLALDALRPLVGGEILVTCPNSFGAPNFGRFIFGRFREGADHVLSFNRFALVHLLERHGYHVESVHTCLDHAPTRQTGRLFYRLFAPLLGHFPSSGHAPDRREDSSRPRRDTAPRSRVGLDHPTEGRFTPRRDVRRDARIDD